MKGVVMREIHLTTVDNPWNPFTHPDEWQRFDVQNGYRTWERIARMSRTSNEMLDVDNEYFVKKAQETLLELFPSVYTFVVKETK